MEINIVEYLSFVINNKYERLEKVVLCGNEYARLFLKKMALLFHRKKFISVETVCWNDREFLRENIFETIIEYCKDAENVLIIYIREPIEDYFKLLRQKNSSAEIREKYSSWYRYLKLFKKEVGCVCEIEYPSNIRSRMVSGVVTTLHEDFVKACTCDYNRMYIDVIQKLKLFNSIKVITVLFNDANRLSFSTVELQKPSSDMLDFRKEGIVIPFGEIYWGLEYISTMEGVFSSRKYGAIHIASGIVTKIQSAKLRDYIGGKVIEFAIGINKGANPDSTDSIAEKAFGTVHIGIIKEGQSYNDHIDIISVGYSLKK